MSKVGLTGAIHRIQRQKFFSAMRISKITLFLLIGLLLLTAAALGALWLVDPAVFRDQLEARASKAFGRPFRIEGAIDLERSLRPRIILQGITIANTDWAAAKHLARAEEVAIQVALVPLLFGEMQVLDVRFTGMELFTEIRPNGTNNFTFGDGGDREAPQRLPSIERLLIRDAVIHHRLARGKIDRYEITQAQLWNIPGEPERIEAEGSAKGMQYRIQFTADSAVELSGPQNPWSVHLEMQGPDMTLTFDGQMAQAFTWDQLEGRLVARGQQVDLLEKLLETETPLAGPFEITAVLQSSEGVYRLTDLSANGQGPSGRPLIAITDGVASVGADGPLSIALQGKLDETPLTLRLESERLPGLTTPETPWPLKATLQLADTELDLSGTMTATASGAIQLNFDGRLQGDSLDTLARLAESELPKTGSFRLAFQAAIGENGYAVNGLEGFFRDTPFWQKIKIEDAHGSVDAQGCLLATMTAALDDVPLSLDIQSVLPPSDTDGWPIQIEATLPGTALKSEGAFAVTDRGHEWQFDTTVQGNRLDKLGTLMGVSLPGIGSYDARAVVHSDGKVHELRDLRAQVDTHRFSGQVRWEEKVPRPLLTGRLSAERLSLNALAGTAAAGTAASRQPSGFLNQPLELAWLETVDARLEIDLKRVTNSVIDIEKVHSSMTLNEGRLRVPFEAQVAGTPVEGQILLSQRRGIPNVSLQATSGRLDAGKTLRKLKLPVVIGGHVEAVEFDGRSRGATLQAMIDHAEASLQFSPASLRYNDQLVDQKIAATVERVKFVVQPRDPITATLSGIVQQVPFEATLRAGSLRDWRADGPLPVAIALRAADMHLTAEGAVNRPFENKTFNLAHDLSGPQIEKLTPLIDLAVPLRGEFHAQGTIIAHGDRFVINENLRIGDSDLQAALTVWRSPARRRVSAQMTSRKIHLDDIELFETQTKEESREATRYVIPDYRIPVDALQSVDLEFDLQAERVVTRVGDLGNLASQVRLKDGLLNSSLTVTGFTGARLRKTLEVNATVDPPLNRLAFEALGLDYGYLESQMLDSNLVEGRLDLYLDLAGPGATRRGFLGNADGHLTIIGGPGRITGRRLDLWASDLIPTLLSPRWQRQSATDVNCVVAHVGVTEGLAAIEDLLLDTRRITIAGSGIIDLETEAIDIFIAPRPKRTSLISLAKPVEIKGTLGQPEVSVARLPSRRRLGRTGLLAGLINPLFLLTTFSDLGTNVADPCGTAVERAEALLEESPP